MANYKKTNNSTLYNNSTNLISYNKEKIGSLTESMILKFDSTVVHGIDRYNDKVILYLYNASKYNEDNFEAAYKGTFLQMQRLN